MKLMKNALVILAGGKGTRIGGTVPKQFKKYGQYNFIEYFLNNISLDLFDILIICCAKKYINKYLNNIKNIKNIPKIIYTKPGLNRQKSSINALKKLKMYNPENVLIHDSARPLASKQLIKKIINKLNKNNSAVPYVIYNDRKLFDGNQIEKNIRNIQTPQGFKFNLIYKAHLKYKSNNFKDDAGLFEKIEKNIKYIKGEKTNLKITYPEDIIFYKSLKKKIFKIGIGYDIHKFNFNNKNGLKLCGVKIPYYKLIGHSDADVGMHAICDSIFGSLSMNDIGYYFSNKNKAWKNANSKIFLSYCKKQLIKKGFYIVNLDINFICEKPNITKYKNKMIKNISNLLSIPTKNISIKSSTNEKIGFIGDSLGIAAESIIQISNEKFY